ncbi:hypothetical protein I7I51_06235 [Histoplasma capsulatum]|uniref:Uncharacterized protein n=1 Tax=Ajellomyces capsulatus TaxID=5037 RepID=A0A8A1MLD2_AJECA|nr:hypothetical protein I7I51_06235 [Histoplasma capsulatum]
MPEAIHGSPQKSIDKNKNKNPKESGEDEQQIKHIIRRCPTGLLGATVRHPQHAQPDGSMESAPAKKSASHETVSAVAPWKPGRNARRKREMVSTCKLFDGSTPLLASYSQGNRKDHSLPVDMHQQHDNPRLHRPAKSVPAIALHAALIPKQALHPWFK